MEWKSCKKCVQVNTRPNIFFDENGVCGACLYHEEANKSIDWDQRERELMEIAEWAKAEAKARNSNYDCVIGVSGGKDSTFQALTARDKMGLKTLLVNEEPEGITEIGKKNIENLKNLGFDVIMIRPNPRIMKKLVKRDFYTYMNPVKVTEYALWASTYIIADKFNIPLIIQGENDCLTLGVRNKQGTGDDALLVNQQDTLASGWEEYKIDGVDERDLFLYHYDEQSLRDKKIRGIWLQYYSKEWSNANNMEFSLTHGLTIRPEDTPREEIGTYALYCQLDSDLVQVNQMLKYIKFGFGQCMDHACYDIRHGRITREEGLEFVRKYDGKCGDQYIKAFCDYIDITVEEFWKEANKWRGDMWKQDENGEWVLKEEFAACLT